MANIPLIISEEAGVRYLHLGSDWIQGAMRLRRPWDLELAYTREMMSGLLLREPPWPENVLLIGLGAGSLAKFIWRYLPQTRCTVVEINPRIPAFAKEHFHVPDDPLRIRIMIGDGVAYMADGVLDGASGDDHPEITPGLLPDTERFDAIMVDGFDHRARPGKLDSLDFYRHCRARLTGNGLFCVNLLGHQRGFKASVARINQAFSGRSLVFPSCDTGNAIAFATGGASIETGIPELRVRATALRLQTGLNLNPVITRIQFTKILPEGKLKI
ncbi:MAG: spermidine synthase [Betaproteobacteria bacterium]|nr:spermidine synthase [Betaproteobacteria bacterium]